jgi:hypothetical protein
VTVSYRILSPVWICCRVRFTRGISPSWCFSFAVRVLGLSPATVSGARLILVFDRVDSYSLRRRVSPCFLGLEFVARAVFLQSL